MLPSRKVATRLGRSLLSSLRERRKVHRHLQRRKVCHPPLSDSVRERRGEETEREVPAEGLLLCVVPSCGEGVCRMCFECSFSHSVSFCSSKPPGAQLTRAAASTSCAKHHVAAVLTVGSAATIPAKRFQTQLGEARGTRSCSLSRLL